MTGERDPETVMSERLGSELISIAGMAYLHYWSRELFLEYAAQAFDACANRAESRATGKSGKH